MPSDLIGQTVGRYRVDAFIGEGGMGRVYRGFDPSLGRPVAIKLLPENVSSDQDRLNRFIREARTASALNHPNVVTIYEIGSADTKQYIAMELLDGETLRDRLAHGKVELRRAIDIASQIAEGTAAAHAAGVIHRDLKPENIVLTKSGFVKILDFGLAKLREAPVAADDNVTAKRTDPGTVLGSVGYMSPEQAAAREVDHRSDIFSIGCILYELATGRRAFSGASSIDTLHKILHDEPAPLRDLTPDVPPELQRIVRKALAKDPDERYQSAKDLAIDLKSLRRDFDSQPKMTSAAAERPRRSAFWAVPLVMVMIAIAYYVFTHRRPAEPPKVMTVSRITASGNVIGAALSPNGDYVAYAYSDAGQHSLFLRQLATGSSLQLVPPAHVGMWGLTFAPDSQSVYYAVKAYEDPSGGLFQIPTLGGTPKRLLAGIDSTVTFSPDGKRIAFTRLNEPSAGHSAVVVANADGSNAKALAVKTVPQMFAPIFWGAPAWSPDGQWIAMAVNTGTTFTLVKISVADGHEEPLTKDPWKFIGHVVWMHDMKSLLMIAASIDSTANQIWSLSYPDGNRRQVTNDLFDYRTVSLTNDDSSLVSVAADQTTSTWLVPINGSGKLVKLSAGKYDGVRGVAATKDEVIFTTRDNGKTQLCSVDPTGANRTILFPNVATEAYSPAVSADGRYIVFTTPRERDWALMRADRDGRNPITLCGFIPSGHPPGQPTITADGKLVTFQGAPTGTPEFYRVSIDGGTPQRIPLVEGYSMAYSPDGKLLAYIPWSNGNLAVTSAAGGGAIKEFKGLSPNNYTMLAWTPDGKAILHNAAGNDRKNVWMQPLDGSPAHAITSFDDQYVLGFSVVPGANQLVVVRGILLRDAVLIKNFR